MSDIRRDARPRASDEVALSIRIGATMIAGGIGVAAWLRGAALGYLALAGLASVLLAVAIRSMSIHPRTPLDS